MITQHINSINFDILKLRQPTFCLNAKLGKLLPGSSSLHTCLKVLSALWDL